MVPVGGEETGLDPRWSDSYRKILGDPVAAVVVSARGIDPLTVDGEAWVPHNGQNLPVAPERYEVVAMFERVHLLLRLSTRLRQKHGD